MAIFSVKTCAVAQLVKETAPRDDSELREKAPLFRLFFDQFGDEGSVLDDDEKRIPCKLLFGMDGIYVLRITTKEIEDLEKRFEGRKDFHMVGYFVVDTRDMVRPAILAPLYGAWMSKINKNMGDALLNKWSTYLMAFGIYLIIPQEWGQPRLNLPFPYDEEKWVEAIREWAGTDVGTVPEAQPEARNEEAQPEAREEEAATEAGKDEPSFRAIIQYPDPDGLLRRLHELIDGRRGADVGSVLLACRLQGHITRNPTQAEFRSEFSIVGSWGGVKNYMSDNNENALDRANRIIIF